MTTYSETIKVPGPQRFIASIAFAALVPVGVLMLVAGARALRDGELVFGLVGGALGLTMVAIVIFSWRPVTVGLSLSVTDTLFRINGGEFSGATLSLGDIESAMLTEYSSRSSNVSMRYGWLGWRAYPAHETATGVEIRTTGGKTYYVSSMTPDDLVRALTEDQAAEPSA